MEVAHIPETNRPRVVIVGGGFAGLKLATQLANSGYQVVVLDKYNHHQFQPLFYQVAMAALEPSAISFPFRKIFQRWKNVHFRLAELLEVMPDEKKILTSIGLLKYDYLALCIGADTNFFGNANIIKNTLPMKSTGEALFIRNTIIQNFESALNMRKDGDISEFLSIVIVGGGPTGVELAGSLAEMKRYVLPKDYPELDFGLMKIVLVESSPELLGPMSKKAQKTALYYLREKLGVEVLLNTRVMDYDGDHVKLGDGSEIRANTVIWAAGVASKKIKGLPDTAYGRAGRLLVDEFNQLQAHEGIFCIGDACYMTTDAAFPNGHPQMAPVAMQQGKHLAKNLLRKLKNKPFLPFKYYNKGAMATVGRNKAVVDTPRFSFTGFFAWSAWLFVHLMYILGTRNRLFIMLNWAWSYLTFDQSLRLLIRPREKQKDGNLEVLMHEEIIKNIYETDKNKENPAP
jgi:NADH:ubiquinone reductase (H+-translocating)